MVPRGSYFDPRDSGYVSKPHFKSALARSAPLPPTHALPHVRYQVTVCWFTVCWLLVCVVLRERVSPTRFEPISYDTFGAELVYLLSSVWYWVGVSPTQRAVRKWRISYHCIVLSSRMVQCKRRNRHQVPGQIPLGAADPGRTRPWLGFVSVFFCRAAVQVSSLQLRAGRGARVCFTRKAV